MARGKEMVWSIRSFRNTVLTELPGSLRSKKRIQKKLKLPLKQKATIATFLVRLQSIFRSFLFDKYCCIKSPPAYSPEYRVTLVSHGYLRMGFRILTQAESTSLTDEMVVFTPYMGKKTTTTTLHS